MLVPLKLAPRSNRSFANTTVYKLLLPVAFSCADAVAMNAGWLGNVIRCALSMIRAVARGLLAAFVAVFIVIWPGTRFIPIVPLASIAIVAAMFVMPAESAPYTHIFASPSPVCTVAIDPIVAPLDFPSTRIGPEESLLYLAIPNALSENDVPSICDSSKLPPIGTCAEWPTTRPSPSET